jgi:hypothetical protein
MRLNIFHVDHRLQYFKNWDVIVVLKSCLMECKIDFFDSFGVFILLSALNGTKGWVLERNEREWCT